MKNLLKLIMIGLTINNCSGMDDSLSKINSYKDLPDREQPRLLEIRQGKVPEGLKMQKIDKNFIKFVLKNNHLSVEQMGEQMSAATVFIASEQSKGFICQVNYPIKLSVNIPIDLSVRDSNKFIKKIAEQIELQRLMTSNLPSFDGANNKISKFMTYLPDQKDSNKITLAAKLYDTVALQEILQKFKDKNKQ